MSKPVVILPRNGTLSVADDLMKQCQIRHVPPLDQRDELCGLIMKKDLFQGVLLRPLSHGNRAKQMMLLTLILKEAMSKDPMTAKLGASLPAVQGSDLANSSVIRKICCATVRHLALGPTGHD